MISPRDAPNIGSMPPIAQAAAGTGTDVAPAVAVVLAVLVIWWVSTHGKGGAALRLIALMMAAVVFWMLLAVNDPSQAGRIAGGAASGVATAISAFGQLFGGI